jgi:hypothetical protein
MTGIRGRLLVGAIAGLAAFVALASGATGTQPKQPDLQLALYTNAGCGAFADSLPPVVTASGVRPGDTVSDQVICVRNVGDVGRLFLVGVADLADVDSACTGDEAAFDATCGGGGPGELSSSLMQRVGVDLCRRSPPIDLTWDRSLPSLSTSPLLLADRLQKNSILCVRLALRYEPGTVAVASQSDRASWRYSFSLTAG